MKSYQLMNSARASNNGASGPVLCRFSDAGNDDLATRSGGRRPKSAKARNKIAGGTLGRPCRRLSYGDMSNRRAT